MKISIVVPVYNTQKYLDVCIDSLCRQEYADLEILLVDDGSTDASPAICDAWAQRDARIRVIHKPNGGLMSAWKTGAAQATGAYIGFADSDDWVDPDMYGKMAAATETGAELVCAALVFEYGEEDRERESVRLAPGYYDHAKMQTDVFPYLLASKREKGRILSPARVTKLYKREMLLRILADCAEEVSIGEDLLTTFTYLKLAQSMYVMGNFFPYHYRINDASMIRTFSTEKYQKLKHLLHALLAVNEKYGGYDYTTQIYTDYVALYTVTAGNEILHGERKGLPRSLRTSFSDGDTQAALAHCDKSMFPRKTRIFLKLMQCRAAFLAVLIYRIRNRLRRA